MESASWGIVKKPGTLKIFDAIVATKHRNFTLESRRLFLDENSIHLSLSSPYSMNHQKFSEESYKKSWW